MNRRPMHQRTGFSLIELVIVVVIIGIIGAIAVPRMSRGAKGAADSALAANLRVLRDAVDHYAAEHGGLYPSAAALPEVFEMYSNADGDSVSTSRDATHLYGPYVRKVPVLPVGANKGSTAFTATPPAGTAHAGRGWYINATTGEIRANCADSEVDEAGVAYNTY